MYCRQALIHSWGVFQELAHHSGPGSLENAWTFLATRFVASNRAAKSAMGCWRFRCSESFETIGSEWHSPLRYWVMAQLARATCFGRQPRESTYHPPSGKYREVSSRPGLVMCGIVACRTNQPAIDYLTIALRRLEYRGYDSVGVAVQTASGEVARLRTVGRVAALDRLVREWPHAPFNGVGIGRTRCATRGSVTEANAHPHADCTGRIPESKGGITMPQTSHPATDQTRQSFSKRTRTRSLPSKWPESSRAFRRSARHVRRKRRAGASIAGNRITVDDDVFVQLSARPPAYTAVSKPGGRSTDAGTPPV